MLNIITWIVAIAMLVGGIALLRTTATDGQALVVLVTALLCGNWLGHKYLNRSRPPKE